MISQPRAVCCYPIAAGRAARHRFWKDRPLFYFPCLVIYRSVRLYRPSPMDLRCSARLDRRALTYFTLVPNPLPRGCDPRRHADSSGSEHAPSVARIIEFLFENSQFRSVKIHYNIFATFFAHPSPRGKG